MLENKFTIQADQYKFPYHYIPGFDEWGYGVRYKVLSWGLEYLCYQEHIKTLVEKLSPNSVIEVGCGDGRFIGRLKSEIRRLGVDLEPRSINFAKSFNDNVEFICSSAKEIDEIFDVCVAIEVLEHISDENVGAFIQALFSKVCNRGNVIICVPTTVIPLNKKHYRHYTEDLLIKQIKDSGVKCNIISHERIYREPAWLKLYLRTTINKYWIFEPSFLRKIVWNYIWKSLRYADQTNGHHIVIVARKEE